jgi:hypothetical protein
MSTCFDLTGEERMLIAPLLSLSLCDPGEWMIGGTDVPKRWRPYGPDTTAITAGPQASGGSIRPARKPFS